MSQPQDDSTELQKELGQLRERLVKLESTRVLLKLAEQALRDNEAALRARFEAIPMPTLTWVKRGPKLVLAELNRAARAVIGEQAGSLVNKPVEEIFRNRLDILNELENCYKQKTSVRWETAFAMNGEQTERDLVLSATYIPPNVLMLHAEDITERKRAEMALRESEFQFRTVAEFTADWEYWRSPDGRFQYVSPSCERLTGYSADEFRADPDLIEKIIVPEDRDLFVRHRKRQKVPGKQYHLLFHIRHKSGRIVRIVQSSQAVADPVHGHLGTRASNRDLDELEALLEKSAPAHG